MQDALERYALKEARRSFDAGEYEESLDWLSKVPPDLRPSDITAGAEAFLAKQAIAQGQWGFAEGHLKKALAIRRDPLLEQRLHFARHAVDLLDDTEWTFLRSKVDRAERLPPTTLAPEITETYTCGTYHAWHDRWVPWSRFLRIAKEAPPDTEEGAAALRLAGEFLCRVVFEETPLLQKVDVVVSVPANPARYARRMVSLPDQLARALKSHFALPFLFDALVSAAPDDLEMRRLSWRERQEAVRGSLRAGALGVGKGRSVLVVDDITTSGATLREAARVLRDAGAGDVYGITLSHTEG